MEISEKHFVTGNNIRPPHPDGFLELRVGMGCFWGPEKIFRSLIEEKVLISIKV